MGSSGSLLPILHGTPGGRQIIKRSVSALRRVLSFHKLAGKLTGADNFVIFYLTRVKVLLKINY